MFSFGFHGIRYHLFEISFRNAILPEKRLVNYVLMFYLGFTCTFMSDKNVYVVLKYCKAHICLAGERVSAFVFYTTEIILGSQ